MKKVMRVSLFAALLVGNAVASDYYEVETNDCNPVAMQRALNRTTADGRAVVTVVKCDQSSVHQDAVATYAARNAQRSDCGHRCGCSQPVEHVVRRQYFVRETVQKYRPVVKYVPDGTYTRTRAVCGDFGC